MPILDRLGISGVLWPPGLVVFAAILVKAGSLDIAAVVGALFMGFVVPVVGYGALGALFLLLGTLFDDKSNKRSPNSVESRHALAAGLLLSSLVWAWWQLDRDTVVTRIVDCVDDSRYGYEPGTDLSQIVLDCYGAEPYEDPFDDRPFD